MQSNTLISFVLGWVLLPQTPYTNALILCHVISIFAYTYRKHVLSTYMPIRSFPLTGDGGGVAHSFWTLLAKTNANLTWKMMENQIVKPFCIKQLLSSNFITLSLVHNTPYSWSMWSACSPQDCYEFPQMLLGPQIRQSFPSAPHLMTPSYALWKVGYFYQNGWCFFQIAIHA